VTVSMGLAEVKTELQSAEAITFAADNLCLEAKRTGKNQICISTESTTADFGSRDEARWISKIKEALENDRFSLFRQSIVKIGTPSPEDHFEVLLRMRTIDGNYCSPGDFLPVAERNGLMPEIDRWVVSAVGKWFENHANKENVEYRIGVNLSPDSLSNTSFRTFLLRWVEQNPETAKSLCFEVTESAAMIDYESTVELLTDLREMGSMVALDDFGTGFSSLSHIRELPLDYIKIDGSFVRDITTNSLNQAVVKSVTHFAQVLDIRTIAEFVETEEALTMLEQSQVDYAQGYLFSQPKAMYEPQSDTGLPKAA